MADRYFENTLQLAAPNDPPVVREILKAAAVALKEVKAAALQHRDVAGGGIYVGLGGIALTYLRMAQQVQRGFSYAHGAYLRKHSVGHSLGIAAGLLAEADKLMASKRVTFLEGASGLLAAQALLAHMQGEHDTKDAKIREVEALWQSRVCGVLPEGECELLYGRAGYLYSLAWLRGQLGAGAVSSSLMLEVVRSLLDEGMQGAARLQQEQGTAVQQYAAPGSSSGGWGLMYSWHGKRYLGAAHGLCGIVYVLLHCMPQVQQLDRQAGAAGMYSAALRQAVDALAAAALPSGNLPTKLGDTQDVRVAWCHGAAGYVPAMLKAADVLGDPGGRYSAAAAAAGEDIWRRGLLKKGVGLCHGICGNGYALLALARATGEARWLSAAQAFALHAARHWEQLAEVPDRPASLYEGLAGAVNFWLDVVDHEHSSWPGAELP